MKEEERNGGKGGVERNGGRVGSILRKEGQGEGGGEGGRMDAPNF